MKPMKKRVISLDISVIGFQEALDACLDWASQRRPGYACFSNAHMTVEALDHRDVQTAVNAANFAFADGMPVAKAMHWLHKIPQERIAGMDFIQPFLDGLHRRNLRVFIFGGSEKTQQAFAETCPRVFPGLIWQGFSPRLARDWQPDEYHDFEKRILAFEPHAVLVILGCPKQERFMARMSGKIPALLLGLGGALPTFLGLQNRAPEWMQRSGLEWVFRFFQEPGRLWKRYLYTNSRFVWALIGAWLNQKRGQNHD
jgi:N-acetylglucosaminyldiphosphoundecaprenol N-acetyl-beta-D-mannosaminyltransferase